MENTKNLGLPLLVPNQSHKEITHNEALIILDNIIQNGAISKNLNIPPENPEQNDLYIIAENATDEWKNKDLFITFYDNGWRFLEPKAGYTFWVKDESCQYTYNGEIWVATAEENNKKISISTLNDVDLINVEEKDILQYTNGKFINTKISDSFEKIGINKNADEINKLSVNSDSILFTAENESCELKINKNTDAANATISLQNNSIDRTKFGLLGNNNFVLKTSVDGENWNDSFTVDNETGKVNFKNDITIGGVSISSGNFGLNLQNKDATKVGYVFNFHHTNNINSVTLPAGGTWWYRIWWVNDAYMRDYSGWTKKLGGFTAGGTTITNNTYGASGFAIKVL